MATCPECDFEIDVDEYDVDRGDTLECDNCGATLEVIGLSPIEFEAVSDEDEDEDDEKEDDEEEEDEDEDEDDDE
jgi:alpha-aminoadipate carrier protein LysW